MDTHGGVEGPCDSVEDELLLPFKVLVRSDVGQLSRLGGFAAPLTLCDDLAPRIHLNFLHLGQLIQDPLVSLSQAKVEGLEGLRGVILRGGLWGWGYVSGWVRGRVSGLLSLILT